MLSFPNCKINLGLQILNKREDGYHNLATVFYPLPLKDALEVVRRDDGRWTTDDGRWMTDDGRWPDQPNDGQTDRIF